MPLRDDRRLARNSWALHVIGLFVLALVTGVGGGLIRDGIFIQSGPPIMISDGRYLTVVILGCVAAALFLNHLARLQTAFLFADALGWVVMRS